MPGNGIAASDDDGVAGRESVWIDDRPILLVEGDRQP
jgi:hypothetical protein